MQLQQVVAIGTAHGGDWSLLDSTEVDTLLAYAQSGLQGAAVFESILEGHNLAEVETDAILPDKFRSMQVRGGITPEAQAPEITAYPTPSDEQVWITYPAELSGDVYRVEDAQGKVVAQGRFEGVGVMQVRTADLADGMYAIVVATTDVKGRLLVKH